ncbi:hypothetical protein TNIN_288421 [Trichonephila inaurata madagascariensis]|uniref:Uncharacterized protein n=1 Tax=Trichonephila inaurata madagascariensis TaxID=2747483 RepID=A0A8X6XMB0_9ARAC|nr:hypothetical protein TNIN_288421 [Trichonephila inaurata madagascariensis]
MHGLFQLLHKLKRCSYPYLGKIAGRRIVVPYTISALSSINVLLNDPERKPRRTKGRTCVCPAWSGVSHEAARRPVCTLHEVPLDEGGTAWFLSC